MANAKVPSKYKKSLAHAAKHARVKPSDKTEKALSAYFAEVAKLNHLLMVKIAIMSEALRAVDLWIANPSVSGYDVNELDDVLGKFHALLDKSARTSKRPKRRARRKGRR